LERLNVDRHEYLQYLKRERAKVEQKLALRQQIEAETELTLNAKAELAEFKRR
jgi:hypothetical protein